ncbi:ABC-type nitrate/sulfonate/bicarbonate transport system permease component [Deinococcus metalli]|uniref:ABC-type nitrate/sulfonate/bicarbonate transport system permease component n=1 Tax=Deinococcus metalli TaxID=1141878 RepID=A0A7W8KBX4_9DEIO|nr:hypothetical protein [Deinococcus metalli]MBB5374923.1 ABC-type nitrate/sulfonate/bicarbonate transport system permease component [Deinococcus metalli]GHF32688.1 hypothetical protein GCM10017781_06740 [Deinococcus metalli]
MSGPGLDFSWLPAEWPGAVQALAVTLGRLLLSLGLGLGGGALLAAAMRFSPRAEALLTPWLLTLLAVPWVLILVALNLIPTLGVRDGTAITVAALACGVQVFALGRRKLEERRSAYLSRALWYAFTAVVASELLSRADGLGAKVRFFALYTESSHLLFYVLLAALVAGAFAGVGRVLGRLLPRTFLGRSL